MLRLDDVKCARSDKPPLNLSLARSASASAGRNRGRKLRNSREKEGAPTASVIAALRKLGSERAREAMTRFAIVSENALGVSVPDIRALAKRIGCDHDLAGPLWGTGIHEARVLTAFIVDPARVTAAQMDRWVRDFDNWAICDTFCFHLFHRTPHAWAKVEKWSDNPREFVKRAAFALLASIALHDKNAPDEPFLNSLRLIESAASDERNFVKKGVSWALRRIGRRNRTLNASAVELARRLAASSESARRWIGKDAMKELTSDAVRQRLRA
jgi:3-methyladenine DNA glycosylase AlkD